MASFADSPDLDRQIEDTVFLLNRALSSSEARTFTSEPVVDDLVDGEVVLWNDTTASAGQPTHYLVARHGDTLVRFASQETA